MMGKVRRFALKGLCQLQYYHSVIIVVDICTDSLSI